MVFFSELDIICGVADRFFVTKCVELIDRPSKKTIMITTFLFDNDFLSVASVIVFYSLIFYSGL